MEENKQEAGVVLCGANSYTEKYYLNPQFERLPELVRQELQVMCVLFTEEVGGVLTLEFGSEGDLRFVVSKEDSDYMFDEIESELRIRDAQRDHEELLQGLELYYRMAFLGQMPEIRE